MTYLVATIEIELKIDTVLKLKKLFETDSVSNIIERFIEEGIERDVNINRAGTRTETENVSNTSS